MEWTTIRVGDIAKINAQSITKKDTLNTIQYIDISSVSTHKMEAPKTLSFSEAPSRAKRKLKNNDFIISTVRPNLKQFTFITKADANLICSTGFCVISAKDENIAWYLYAFLTSDIFTNYLVKIADGGAYPAFNSSEIENAIIPFPPEKELIKISNWYKTLFFKITLNTQTNQTLEQIAQAIFKHWFIDFAPVHAKANALARGETIEQAELAAMVCLSGKTAEKITALKTQDPTAYHQLQQTAAAFPSEFVETEMGQVPKGREVCSITDKRVCSIIKPKIHHFSGEKDYIATANVSQNTIVGELEKITFDNRPSRANMQPIVDSIWFAKMVGEHKAIMIDENDEFLLKNTILSTGFLGIKPQQYKKCFLYCFINSENFTLLKNSLATGAVQIALNNTSFSSMNIILPSDNVLEYFENKVSTLFSKIATNHRENKSLAETRDLLLPKLLNGEIEL